MRDLIATRPLTYATRRLQAGDTFTPRSAKDAKVLIALRKAKAAGQDQPGDGEDDLTALRARYASVFGKRPFMGWDADKLREKIAEHAESLKD